MSLSVTQLIDSGQFACLREWPGYAVSSDGYGWTCHVNLGRGHFVLGDKDHHWRKLKPGRMPKGHLILNLSKNGKGQTHLLHRLILETFVGPCPPGMECCHKDDNPGNNDLSNLRWDTKRGNRADSRRNGGYVAPPRKPGSLHPNSKLTESKVLAIRELYRQGASPTALAKEYGVSVGAIEKVIYRKSWTHVP